MITTAFFIKEDKERRDRRRQWEGKGRTIDIQYRENKDMKRDRRKKGLIKGQAFPLDMCACVCVLVCVCVCSLCGNIHPVCQKGWWGTLARLNYSALPNPLNGCFNRCTLTPTVSRLEGGEKEVEREGGPFIFSFLNIISKFKREPKLCLIRYTWMESRFLPDPKQIFILIFFSLENEEYF